MDDVVARGDLIVTDAAHTVAGLFKDPPPEAEWRPILRVVSRWAFGTLPPALRAQYGEPWNAGHEALMRASMASLRVIRPVLPRRFRYIVPAEAAFARAR
jgi:uncharacterized protein (DUF2236 family)